MALTGIVVVVRHRCQIVLAFRPTFRSRIGSRCGGRRLVRFHPRCVIPYDVAVRESTEGIYLAENLRVTLHGLEPNLFYGVYTGVDLIPGFDNGAKSTPAL